MTRKVILLKNKTEQLDKYERVCLDEQFEPVFIPLITHTHEPGEALSLFCDFDYLEKLQHIIITSQRTVECLTNSILPKLDERSRELLLNTTVYTVGPTTADLLKLVGFANVLGGEEAGNGDILSDIIIQDLLQNSDKPTVVGEILFLVGEIRRDIIPRKLSQVSLNVREVVVYKTRSREDSIQKFVDKYQEGDWVVVFSPQGSIDILEYLKNNHSHYNLASIGPTTEKYLNELQMPPVVTSAKPNAMSLLEAINQNLDSA